MSLKNSLELNVILEQVEGYCSFSLGKQLIHDTEPSFDPLIIRRNSALIKDALICQVKYGKMPFPGITDISQLLYNAQKSRILSAQDCMKVLRFIGGIRQVLSYREAMEEDHPALDDLVETLILHSTTEKMLNRIFNEYGEIKDNASSELKRIRAALRKADDEIISAANKFVASHPNSVVDGIITYRAGRAVILVKAGEKNTFGGMFYGDSASGQASYIEPAVLAGPNTRKQQLVEEEQEEIRRILKACSDEIKRIAPEELANLETCAILDALFAKAAWGAERNACAADLSSEKKFELIKARHPLIDPEKVVANTYHLEEPVTMLLITGPNTGGKTVSMKIIGLFVLMTYAGMPVTADEAVIPYFDRVFADIGDDQSVVSSLSSFSAHMTKQAEVLREASGSSLVLLDEVGSGTDPREGEALAIAIMNELRERKTMSVITTHYDRLKAYGKRHDDVLVASVAFDMDKLVPTYAYVEGLTGQSNALEVAQRYGVPSGVIKYARNLKNQSKTKEDELIERLEQQLNEAVTAQNELNRQIEENRILQQQLRKEKEQLEKQKETFRENAQKEADAYIESVQKKADKVLRNIRKRQENAKYHEALDAVKELNQLHVQADNQEEDVPEEHEYHVGDAVEVKGSSQVCEIIHMKRKDITILMNGREVHVKKEQIRPSMHVLPKMKVQNTVSVNTGRNLFSVMPLEVNLIGLHVDEAMDKFEGYLDQVKLNKLNTFRVIHGDGSGRLRNAVHERLKRDQSVKSYRLGMPQEGGTGATVVTMK